MAIFFWWIKYIIDQNVDSSFTALCSCHFIAVRLLFHVLCDILKSLCNTTDEQMMALALAAWVFFF